MKKPDKEETSRIWYFLFFIFFFVFLYAGPYWYDRLAQKTETVHTIKGSSYQLTPEAAEYYRLIALHGNKAIVVKNFSLGNSTVVEVDAVDIGIYRGGGRVND